MLFSFQYVLIFLI